MSKAFDDSAYAPPSYDAISSTSVSANSVWCKRSLFSFLQSKQKRRAPALSRIREIVSYPDYTPSSVESIVNSCAATLPTVEFSKLLQRLNIEDHTALYWAILNNRREALWAFYKFISEFSPNCALDLRLACTEVNDHDLFMQLNLGDTLSAKDKSLRRMLGCPQDKIDVFEHGLPRIRTDPPSEHDKLGEDHFFVDIVFRMFQKRLRFAQNLGVEFIARGRIWALKFYMGLNGKWQVEYCLSDHSLPVPSPSVIFVIMEPSGPPDTRCEDQNPLLAIDMSLPSHTLLPEESCDLYTDLQFNNSAISVAIQLDDWPMDDDTAYVHSDGTLRVGLQMQIYDCSNRGARDNSHTLMS